MTDLKKNIIAQALATLCQNEDLDEGEKDGNCLLRLDECPFKNKHCSRVTPYDWLDWMEEDK